MTFSVNKLQEFLTTELGFDSQQITTRNFHSWNRFYADNDFIYLKPIKDRSPEGMMKILKGDKFRWQIRVGVHHDDDKPDHLIITLWDSGEGTSYDSLIRGYIDKGKPVFMARKIKLNDSMYEQLITHCNYFEKYALSIENECPSCGGILVPRKKKKLLREDPYTLSRAVTGPNAIPKQRTYLACNDYPSCKHIASYVKV
jgi:rRNA maturation protein Nop10